MIFGSKWHQHLKLQKQIVGESVANGRVVGKLEKCPKTPRFLVFFWRGGGCCVVASLHHSKFLMIASMFLFLEICEMLFSKKTFVR